MVDAGYECLDLKGQRAECVADTKLWIKEVGEQIIGNVGDCDICFGLPRCSFVELFFFAAFVG